MTIEDWTLYRTVFDQLPPRLLSVVFRRSLRSTRRVLSALICLILDLDAIGSFQMLAANTDHVSFERCNNMIVAIVLRRVYKCLGYCLSSLEPTRAVIKQVLKGCVESLKDESGSCHKVLLEWLSRKIDDDELVTITNTSMGAILSSQNCQMRSKLITAVVGHQIGNLLPYLAVADNPSGESSRAAVLEQLIRDAGSSYQDDTNQARTLPSRRKMEDPSTEVGDKILRLRAHRYLHYSSKMD